MAYNNNPYGAPPFGGQPPHIPSAPGYGAPPTSSGAPSLPIPPTFAAPPGFPPAPGLGGVPSFPNAPAYPGAAPGAGAAMPFSAPPSFASPASFASPPGLPGPPGFGGFAGMGGAPGMAAAPGLGPTPGMSAAPGMPPAPGTALPPGIQQANAPAQANRPSGLPASFQPPPNLPNINFSAAVIRLGGTGPSSKPSGSSAGDRRDSGTPTSSTHRAGLGFDRNIDQSRAQVRESMQNLVPPTPEERLRTIMVHKIPEGVGGDESIRKLLSTVGHLRRWDSASSQLSDHKGKMFGFAQYEDPDSLAAAVELLKDVEVPVKKQTVSDRAVPDDDAFEDIEKVKLEVAVDPRTVEYLESLKEGKENDANAENKLSGPRAALKQYIRELFYPQLKTSTDGEGDTTMTDGTTGLGENVEVINISLAQDDELADIPAEMREVVAAEIAAFRERSNQRDLERLRREEEFEEMERQRSGANRAALLDGSANAVPLGPRGVPNAPSGPRGQNRGIEFVNGGATNGRHTFSQDDEDTDASDEELHRRELAKQKAEDEKLYLEAERKWVNRERQRAAALDREKERERSETDGFAERRREQLEREKNWDDDREAAKKAHLYYRDHAAWIRKRAAERAEEEARDEADRRAESEERRKVQSDLDQAKGMADAFLEQQAEEMEKKAAAPAAPQRITISFGAAAQKAQAQRSGPVRRTIAEVEGLLDDEEQDQTTKRQLVPIKFEPLTDTKVMTDQEIQEGLRALAQEIPTEKDGLWAWEVKWDYLDEPVIREKLRPFVEKKIVEYLGVQEQFLVEMVEKHIREHGKPAELVETLTEVLDEVAEDLVKKLWRMVIFYTESEKRGLPA